MPAEDAIVIVGAARTAIGNFQGAFASLPAPQLGAAAIRSAVERSGLKASDVGEVLMGCVLPAGQGQAPARQALLGAGLAESVPATTVNKMCGSGMKAVMLAADGLLARPDEVIVAGGMESMTGAPHLIPKMRGGLRLGHGTIEDHMFRDGLEDAYDRGVLMGRFAEATAEAHQITRADQDAFAVESLRRAKAANEDGSFAGEIVPVTVKGRKGEDRIARDEQPFAADPAKIPTLKSAFKEGGTVTAANSSSISDGAAALVLMREREAERRGVRPLARILGSSTHAQAPAWFTTAPIGAIHKLQDRLGWETADADLYEINEAFAVVTLVAMRELGLPHDAVNVHGGACALGHPIGASGARIIVTLLNALGKRGARRGIASLCIGGGEATAIAVELIA